MNKISSIKYEILFLKKREICKRKECNFKQDCGGLNENREGEFHCDLEKLIELYKNKLKNKD
jgi:hypothetical protein